MNLKLLVRKPSFTWNSHSVIHFAISHRPTRGSISPYYIAGLNIWSLWKSSYSNCQKLSSSLMPLPRGTTANIRIQLISLETRLIGLYFLTDCMGLPLFKFVQWAHGLQKMHLFCNRVHFGHSRSSKVFDFIDFGTNQKCICDFLLVCHYDCGPILHRFWDTPTYWLKIAYFSYPSHSAPSLPVLPLEFCAEVNREETRVMGYPTVKTAWS